MRLRHDSAILAGLHRAFQLGNLTFIEGQDWSDVFSTPPAMPGDVWYSYTRSPNGVGKRHTGYALTCPNSNCKQGVHHWDHGWNCRLRFDPDHNSCWRWAGSAEMGNLTASPSLHVLASRGGCGWHGHLMNGNMISV